MNNSPPTHLPKPPRAWLTLLMGGILLISGMVIGGGGATLLLKHRIDQPDTAPKHFSGRLVKRLTRDLDLTQEQTKQVRTIMEAHQEEMRSIRMQIKDEVDASFASLKTEVETVLTPEQALIWEERIHDYQQRPPHKRGPGGKGDGRHRPPPHHRKDGGEGQYRDGDHRRGDERHRDDKFDGRRPPPRHGDDRDDDRPPPPDGRRSGEQPPPPPSES